MPILPPINTQNYDTVTNAVTSAKARLNDSLPSLYPVGGGVLGLNQPTTLQSLNSAWRRMQDTLAARGYARLLSEAIISSIPVVGSQEPASQTWLGWSGFFDGQNLFPQPALPSNFTHPLKIWERWSGQNAEFCGPPMEKILAGLPAVKKVPSNRFWEWREDAMWMPGSLNVMDLRIRFISYLPDFSDIGNIQWFQQPVPITRGSDALSWFLCSEVTGARGDTATSDRFLAKGVEALNHLFNLDVEADQFVNVQRQPRGGRNRRSSD